MSKIVKIIAREIIDSRGYPTVETEVHLEKGFHGKASVPSGASVGSKEAIELRDKKKKRFFGKGVLKSVNLINTKINNLLKNKNAEEQEKIDQMLISLDGTPNKSYLGSNTILSVSLAVAKAASAYKNIPFYQHIADLNNNQKKLIIPIPMINILNGGKHSNNNIDIQEFMIQPTCSKKIKSSIQMGSEIFHHLGFILNKKKFNTSVGDEGGYAPNLKSNEEALKMIKKAIKKAGYILGKDIVIAIDCAASELYNKKEKKYIFKNEKKKFSSKEFTHYLKYISKKYYIKSIEDGQDESDWNGFVYQTKTLGKKIQIVGDDLFVTNTKLLKKGIKKKAANAILIKPNQIGTMTETFQAIKVAKKAGFKTIISHRSGETEDTSIADISVGTNAGQIKTGSMSRSERTSKYNQLIRIEENLL